MAFYECVDKVKPFITTETVFDTVITFNDTYGNIPLVTCDSLISGYQEGSGTPSPDNVRPLHAFSSASLCKCDNNTASLWSIDNSFNGDVEFNQLIQNGNFASTSGWVASNSSLSVNNNEATVIAGGAFAQIYTSLPCVLGHKYFMTMDVKASIADKNIRFYQSNTDYGIDKSFRTTLEYSRFSTILNIGKTGNPFFGLLSSNSTADMTFIFKNVMVHDLTAMFGSTIADYIYTLEQGTAGAGVAFFKSIYPNDYYPYNAGTKQLVGDTLATFTFGQSIYHGSIDWKRGVVRGDYKVKIFDGSEVFTQQSGNRVYTDISDSYSPETTDIKCVECSHYEAVSQDDSSGDNKVWKNAGNYSVTFRDSVNATTVTDFQNYLSAQYQANTPVTLAYRLATPIEIPLGGINLLTQEGQNNIFCDTGDTTVEYIKIT